MKNYITQYQLLNFQSWDNKTDPISLEQDMINIIEGENETGKSVLYKVLYNFAFPGYWNANELIRRGCAEAVMVLRLSNLDTILYHLTPKHHTYLLETSQGDTQSWSDSPLPQEIITDLGLILDYESKIILNVIDKDVALPFIKTSPKFNASLIRAVIEPPDITNFFANVATLTTDLETARLGLSAKTKELKAAAEAIRYTDIDSLQLKKSKVDEVLAVTASFSEVDKALQGLCVTRKACPDKVTSPEEMRLPLSCLDRCLDITASLVNLKRIISNPVTPQVAPTEVAQCITALDKLVICQQTIQSLADILCNKPHAVPEIKLDTELQASTKIGTLLSNVCDIKSLLAISSDINAQMSKVQAEIDEIKLTVGVCPTCGRLLE